MRGKITNISVERGFTMVELVTVMVIIGILATVAAVNFSSGDAVKLEAATKKVVNDIYYAQDLAMSTGSQVQVVFNVAQNQYSLKWGDGTYIGNVMGGGDFIVDLDNPNFSGVELGSSDLTGGTLSFNSLGVPSSGGQELQAQSLVIKLNSQVSVFIAPYTGRLEIDEEE